MINPFTAHEKITQIQKDVLQPLYTLFPGNDGKGHGELLAETGQAIARHADFIHAVSESVLVALAFSIIKLLGGAEQLTQEDFNRFTSYVRDGGIEAMLEMLAAEDREGVFVSELQRLPQQVRRNAPLMLAKANLLHTDYITEYFIRDHGSLDRTPSQLRQNFTRTTAFIERLTELALQHQHR